MTDPAVSPWKYVYGDFILTIECNIACQCSSIINASNSSCINSLMVIIKGTYFMYVAISISEKLSKVSA